MSWTEIDTVGAATTTGNEDSVTTAAIDTTGANALFAFVATDNIGAGGAAGAVTDSKGNTWTGLTAVNSPIDAPRGRFFYCKPTSVGSGHTFTYTRTDGYPSIYVWAYDSGNDTFEFDDENGAPSDGSTSNLSPGSVTPSADGALILAGLALNGGTATDLTADSSFTYSAKIGDEAGVSYGVVGAEFEQTTAAAKTTLFDWNGSVGFGAVACIAAFLPAADAPPAGVARRNMLLGVG